MLILNSEQTGRFLTFDKLVPALRDSFRQEVSVPLRHTHRIGAGASDTMLIMPAWNDQGYCGVKVINIFPDNHTLGLPGLHATYNLYSTKTGVPLAILDGDVITAYRTAGAAALAASYLARVDAKRLLIVGAGRIAGFLAQAFRSVRPIQEVEVWDIDANRSASLARRLVEQGFEARSVHDLEKASGRADVISCATLSQAPLVRGHWLRAGVHLDLIGSFTPIMRETDSACFGEGRRVYMDTDEAIQKSGDLLFAMQDGALTKSDIVGDLFSICRKVVDGRRSEDEITVFKAVGTALEDLAAAQLIYESAVSAGNT